MTFFFKKNLLADCKVGLKTTILRDNVKYIFRDILFTWCVEFDLCTFIFCTTEVILIN